MKMEFCFFRGEETEVNEAKRLSDKAEREGRRSELNSLENEKNSGIIVFNI